MSIMDESWILQVTPSLRQLIQIEGTGIEEVNKEFDWVSNGEGSERQGKSGLFDSDVLPFCPALHLGHSECALPGRAQDEPRDAIPGSPTTMAFQSISQPALQPKYLQALNGLVLG